MSEQVVPLLRDSAATEIRDGAPSGTTSKKVAAKRPPAKKVVAKRSPANKKAAPRKTAPAKRAIKRSPAAASTGAAGAPARYRASLWPRREDLDPKLVVALRALQDELAMPIWLLLQDGPSDLSNVDDLLVHLIRHQRNRLPEGQPIAVVLNSPGGSARCAYGLARILQRRCGSFKVVVPDAAMSAATLFSLGADEIIMGPDASLGPLDAQIMDPEAERFSSVLDEVQALERLRAYALESIDETMQLLLTRTRKRVETLLPLALRFVADSMQPLLDKIDVVHYNERARILKVGEEYAVRLLRRGHEPPQGTTDPARMIASRLVEEYPEHGFWIDREEAERIGLQIAKPTAELDRILERLWEAVQGETAIGAFEEVRR